jgi:small subunit ribosomal protein S2
MPYVTERWLGGTLTNFAEISRLIKKYSNLKKQKTSGQLEKYTKKEQLDFTVEIEKLDKLVGGIESLVKIPDAIFICDVKQEKTAVNEAVRKNIPLVAIVDTNVDPSPINYLIPANDDAIKSIDLITSLVAQAVKEGLQEKEGKIKEAKATAIK